MLNFKEQASAVARQENGVKVDLIDPITREDTGAWIRIAGVHSRRALDARRKAVQQILLARNTSEKRGDLSAEEKALLTTMSLAMSIIEWHGILEEEGGVPLDCTYENAMALLSQVGWIEDALDIASGDQKNF